MKYTFSLFKLSVLLFFFYSCTRPNEGINKEIQSSYIAINGSDTAWLTLVTKGTTFKGKCIINFSNKYTDSGDVKGKIKGDTLLGDFHYSHYGLERDRKAFALLRNKGNLVMGEGKQGVFLDIPYFEPGIPIRFDGVKFVFENVNGIKQSK